MSLQAAIHVIDLSVVWQTDPSHATLDWLLELITERIDANPEAEYLIDFIPNLKYMLRAKFLQENISEALEKFEEKVGVIYRLLLFFAVGWFLPCDAMLLRCMLSSCVLLSVCPSVTRRYCTKTAKPRIKQTTPRDSLVFWCQISRQDNNGVTPDGGTKARWNGFRSKTVQVRDIGSVEC